MKTMLNSIPSASNDAENNTNDDVITSAHYIRNTVLVAVDICPPTKCCSKCKVEKSFEQFGKEIKGKYGLKSSCKICSNGRCNNWKKKNPEKVKILDRKWKETQSEKVKIVKANWRAKPENKIKVAEYCLKSTKILSNRYVSNKLRQMGFKTDELKGYPELIEVKRIQIKTKRLCKTSQN